jgi:flavin reductase (DIM6/NTAB) family NADH-FMN oxidoreductase RutF
MDPPMMLVCVNRRNHSLEAIRASSGFTVNLLRVDSGPISALFASPSPDKFSLLSWRPSPVSGLPWLYADALAFVDCRLVADVAAASHAILIGLVTDVHSDISENGQQAGGPLVYWRRHYGGWSAPAFSIGPGQD